MIYSKLPNVVDPIVMEASSPEDQKYMRTMTKPDINQINATLVQKLYENVLKYNTCDFGDIPKSKGKIMKVVGIDDTIQCLDILMQLHTEHDIPTEDIVELKATIATMNRLSNSFEFGFSVDNDYLVITYNTIIMAIMDSTSKLIADYTTYMVTPDNVTYNSGHKRGGKNRGNVSIDIVRRFNKLAENGTLDGTVNSIVTSATKRSAGTRTDEIASTGSLTESVIGAVTVTAAVLLGLKALVNLVREAIFLFYHSRVKISDYLETQATFLEMNRLVVQSSNKNAFQQKKILKNQEKVILKLRRLSDKIKINSEDAETKAFKTAKNENAMLSLSEIEKTVTTNKLNGVSIQVI